ncbi:hypothetical protein [Clostridium tyrobutyricum]|nr:hypothetical protein [Clostridium tyrobutyricum]MBV4438596.1 hypothetical protein [Clostridium tyrobutyricum]
MNNDRLAEILKEEAKRKEYEDEERKVNPLAFYSTSQLKAELRRRKRS